MPRSSFSENPLLRRSAKVKCDGKLPACTACEKAGRESECSAANDQFARGKERSYVSALELRIEKLEKRLSYAKSRKASVAMHQNETPVVPDTDRKDSLATIRAAIYRKAARKRENSDVNSLVSDFGFLSVNATTRDFEPSVSNMTFARLVLAAATNDPVPEPKSTKLPPRQTAQAIVQYYLNNIYSLFPFFDETILLSRLEELYQEQPRLRSTDYWLVYMVLAIGATAQSRSNQDDFYRNGLEFASRALPYADRALAPGHLTQIQSLILLTQYSMLDPAHFDSWHLIGITCRVVIDLGYHQDPPPNQQLNKETLDMRRKLFYSVYALDRAISLVHARPFSFTDDSVNVDLPSMAGLGRIPSISGTITGPRSENPAVLWFQLRRCQSQWYQTLFQSDPTDPLQDPAGYIWQMCFEMREWSESLPKTLPVAIRELFDLELKYSYVYCIAPSGRAPHMTAYGRMLIFEYAISYVDRVFELAHGPFNAAFYTYHDALRVYFMGSQFVAVLRDAADALLAGSSVPVPLALPGRAPPPPMPPRSGGDNLDRSLGCIEKAKMTLKKYGERWTNANMLSKSFDMMSGEVLASLQSKKMMREAAQQQQQQQQMQYMSNSIMPSPLQPVQQSQGPVQEVQWADVDIQRIIRGEGM